MGGEYEGDLYSGYKEENKRKAFNVNYIPISSDRSLSVLASKKNQKLAPTAHMCEK